MFTCLLEGRLDPPAGHEALEDSGSFEVKVGTKKRLRVTLAGWITHQHPADRSWGHTVVIPDGRSGDILQLAGLTTIPLGQHDRCPYGFRIGKDGAEFGPAFAFNCRSSDLTLLAFGYRFEQTGVETQPGDQADVPAHSGDQFQCREAAVGNDNHAAIRQPSFGLQYRLLCPFGQGLVPPPLRLAPARRRRQHSQRWQCPPPACERYRNITASDRQRKPLVLTKWPCDDRTASR